MSIGLHLAETQCCDISIGNEKVISSCHDSHIGLVNLSDFLPQLETRELSDM